MTMMPNKSLQATRRSRGRRGLGGVNPEWRLDKEHGF
jgi:hypothetical protein